MEILEIQNSSAISKISFNTQENIVGISFTSNPTQEYLFVCEEIENVKSQVQTTESVGKLISLFRKNGTFLPLNS